MSLVTASMLKEWDTEILMSHMANLVNAMNDELKVHKAEIERCQALITSLENRQHAIEKRVDKVQGVY